MAARLLDIWCVLGAQRAVAGPQEPQAAEFTFFELNNYKLRLHAQTPVLVTGSLDRFIPADFSEFATFEAALGYLDAAPTAGTFRMRLVGTTDETADIPFDATPAQLADALNLLPDVAATDGVEVSAGKAANVYVIRPADPDDDFTFEVHSISLVPLCAARVRKASDGDSTYTMVKIFRAYLAEAPTSAWSFPTPPPPAIHMQRTGSSVRNCVQWLEIPAGAVGQLDLVHDDAATPLLDVATLTAAQLTAALNGLFADGASNPRFAALAASPNGFLIECVGPLAAQAVALLTLELFGQEPLNTPEADFALTELPLELDLAGVDSEELVFEVTAYDGDGNPHTLLQETAAIVRNTLIDPEVSALVAAVATVRTIVYTSVDPDAPTIIGQRSATVGIAGSGTVSSEGEYTLVFTHNLDTLTPGICIFEMVNVSPAKWRLVPETEYDARSDGDPDTVSITFAHTPPTPGHVGALKVFATNFDAQIWSNEHTHPLTAIYRASDDATLDEILDELAAALPTGWPAIPASKLTGLLTPAQLDLDALAVALRSNGEFLTTLRTLITDTTLIEIIGTALAGNASFVTTIANALVSNPAFTEAVRTLFLDLLTGNAPRDSVLIRIPDLDTSFPALLAGSTPATPLYPPLPAIQNSPTDGGSLTGYAPKAASGNAGTYRTVATVAHLAPHRRKTFADGDKIFSDGFDWWKATVDGVEYYAGEFDRQLFAIAVNDTMLGLGTRFSLAFAFTASLAGNCTGYYLFELKRGTANSAGAGPVNLSTVTWDETVISAPIHLTDAAVTHNFAYTVSRAAGGTLSSTKASYLGTAAVGTVPGAPRFVLLAQLTHFDVQNVTAPAGQVKLTMKAATASIVKL